MITNRKKQQLMWKALTDVVVVYGLIVVIKKQQQQQKKKTFLFFSKIVKILTKREKNNAYVIWVERNNSNFFLTKTFSTWQTCRTNELFLKGVHYSTVDSYGASNLPPWVRVPSMPSMLWSFIVIVLYLSCGKNENKQKRGRVWPIS